VPRKQFDPEQLSFERMPGEPGRAFSAFRMYRDMGPDRSLENVRLSLGKSESYSSSIFNWSTKYEWVERSALYDNHLDQQQRKESEKSIAFWEAQRQQSLLANLETARMMRERLHEMMSHPLTKQIMKSVGGREVTMIMPAKWTFSTVASLAKVMAEMEAATIGEALAGAVDSGFDPETATLEELREYVNRTRKK
jgi:hypothetical protein